AHVSAGHFASRPLLYVRRRMESAANEAVRDRFRGRRVRAPEVALIREVVAACAGLSRKELANTISELLGWTRPSGALKEPECCWRSLKSAHYGTRTVIRVMGSAAIW